MHENYNITAGFSLASEIRERRKVTYPFVPLSERYSYSQCYVFYWKGIWLKKSSLLSHSSLFIECAGLCVSLCMCPCYQTNKFWSIFFSERIWWLEQNTCVLLLLPVSSVSSVIIIYRDSSFCIHVLCNHESVASTQFFPSKKLPSDHFKSWWLEKAPPTKERKWARQLTSLNVMHAFISLSPKVMAICISL